MTARQLAWRACYELIAARVTRPEWSFMNYGYAPTAEEGPPLALAPEDEPDRFCIQLYHHAVATRDLRGTDVLEVGCGRGGGSSFISRYLGPRSTTGLDFSAKAIALCRRERHAPGLRFVHGDAQALPFPDESFDVVVNIESSHCYSSVETFLSEVARVLRPGGTLHLADLRGREGAAELKRMFRESPLTVLDVEDVTAPVLRAMRQDNARKLGLIDAWIPRPFHAVFRPFAGIEGTRNYDGLAAGDVQYLSAVLEKPVRTSD